jgi:membrane-associated protease RseP (regulator of RpoE activity)
LGLLGWVIFLLALCVSIMVHETGHFVTAKKFGMKVTRYFLGFGPTLWSIQRGETEYGVKLLLLGGFCKIVGMHSLDDPDDPADEPRSFRSKPAWQRLIVLYAGIVVNLILAFVLVAGMALVIGIENENTTQLGTVTTCVPANNKDLTNGVCGDSQVKAPALLAGLKVGDTVVDFNGKPVSTWTQLGDLIKAAPVGSAASITVLRSVNGHQEQVTLHATLAHVAGRSGAYLGIAATNVFQVASPLAAIRYAGSFYAEVLSGTGQAISNIPSSIPKLFNKKERSENSGDQIGSVITYGQQTSEAIAANAGWQYKVEIVLLLAAELNIILGLGNFLPLMPLDGGLAAVVIWEWIRGWIARLRGRPDPGPVDIRKVVPVMVSVFMVVAVFCVVVMFADIFNPLKVG